MRGKTTAALAGLLLLGLLPTASQAGVRHAGWHSPVAISGRGDFSRVAVAVNARGDAIAVWDRSRFSPPPYLNVLSYALEAAFKPAGRAWQRPVILTPVPGGCPDESCVLSSLSVAIGPQGQAVVVWPETEYNGPGPVWAMSRSADGLWQGPVMLDANPGAASTQVVLDSHGNATAIWTGFGNTVRVASQPAGGMWGQPITIGSGYVPQLAVDANGDLTAAWDNGSPPGGTSVQTASKPAAGSWSQPLTLAQGPSSALLGQVAVDPHGDAIVSLAIEKPGGCGCASTPETAFKPAGGAWRTPIIVIPPEQGEGDIQLALASGGRATAVWSDNGKVQAASSSPGGLWHAPVTIAHPHARVRNLQLAGNARGDTLAIWLHPFPSPFAAAGVKGAIRPAHRRWRRAITFKRGSSSDETSPTVGLDAHGDAVVAWVHNVGRRQTGIEAATYTRR